MDFFLKLDKTQKSVLSCIYTRLFAVFVLAMIVYFIFIKTDIDEKIKGNDNAVIGIVVSWILLTIFYIGLSLFSDGGRKYKGALSFLFTVWMLLSVFFVALPAAAYDSDAVQSALIITVSIFFVMTMIGFAMIRSKKQFNMLYMALIIIFIGAVLTSILYMRYFDKDPTTDNKFEIVISGMITVLCILFIAFDTWFYIGSEWADYSTVAQRCRDGTMNIWLDVMNVFLYMLEAVADN